MKRRILQSLEKCQLSCSERLVLEAIYATGNDYGYNCQISVKALMGATGYKRSQVKRALRALEERYLIYVTRRKKTRALNHINRYTINFTPLLDLRDAMKQLFEKAKGYLRGRPAQMRKGSRKRTPHTTAEKSFPPAAEIVEPNPKNTPAWRQKFLGLSLDGAIERHHQHTEETPHEASCGAA